MKYEFLYLERPECTGYTMLNDETRSVDYGTGTSKGSNVQGKWYCDKHDMAGYSNNILKSPGWEGSAWYRFTMPAGTRIPESSPGLYHCGTIFTGWLSGVHPTSPGASINVKFCFTANTNDCYSSTQGKVTNCGSYFVYYLENTRACQLRYCATN